MRCLLVTPARPLLSSRADGPPRLDPPRVPCINQRRRRGDHPPHDRTTSQEARTWRSSSASCSPRARRSCPDRPETASMLTMAERARGRGLRRRVDRRLDHGAPAPRAADPASPPSPPAPAACASAPPSSCPRCATPWCSPTIVGTLDRIAEGRVILGVGIAGRHAGHPQGVRRGGRAVGPARRALPRDARDLPRALEPRRRELHRASTSRSTTSRWSRSRTRPGGPPDLDRRQRPHRAARGRALRRRGSPPAPAQHRVLRASRLPRRIQVWRARRPGRPRARRGDGRAA